MLALNWWYFFAVSSCCLFLRAKSSTLASSWLRLSSVCGNNTTGASPAPPNTAWEYHTVTYSYNELEVDLITLGGATQGFVAISLSHRLRSSLRNVSLIFVERWAHKWENAMIKCDRYLYMVHTILERRDTATIIFCTGLWQIKGGKQGRKERRNVGIGGMDGKIVVCYNQRKR